jgi:hypothetical protein
MVGVVVVFDRCFKLDIGGVSCPAESGRDMPAALSVLLKCVADHHHA